MIKGFMKEKDLRKWLKEQHKMRDKQRWGSLLWTEAAMGGTSGLPDCAVQFLGSVEGEEPVRFAERFEIELKVWAADQGGLLLNIRPAQVAYHRWKGGGLSWFLIGVNRVHVGKESACWGEVGICSLWMLKGRLAVAGRRSAEVEKNMVRVESWKDVEHVLLGE